MSESKPKHVILIVADSLRYDSVYQNQSPGLPYMEKFATQFTNASSPACWTLPATASLFTGQLPHQHKATTQTRSLNKDSITLAEIMKKQEERKGLKISQLFMLLGKHRIRKKLFSKDAISDKLSTDLRAGSVWFRSFYKLMFDYAQEIITEHEKKGEKAFLFINLMETHFPYHIDTEFKLSSSNPIKKLSELMTLFSIVNQTFLTKENVLPQKGKLETIKSRQGKSWDLIRKDLDEFVQSLHEDKENLVVFTSDHGENFGDQDWVYHFSNVTDACTRVPIFWLDHNGIDPGVRDHKTSSRLLFHSIAKKAGYKGLNGHDIFSNNIYSIPISQSYWYNHHGKTLDKYRYNQFCFHYEGMRYLKKNGSWAIAESTEYKDGKGEKPFEKLAKGVNPINEIIDDQEAKKYLDKQLQDFLQFEKKIES